MNVSDTMKVKQSFNLTTQYVVIKIGDKVYSTTFSDMEGKDISTSMVQITETKGIGTQKNIWIKGKFTEGKGHKSIDAIPFEINIYSKTNKKC